MESRRDFLKKSAIVGGLVWAAPTVTTVSRAGAQGTPPRADTRVFAVRIQPQSEACTDLGANPQPAQCPSVAPGAEPGGCAHIQSVTVGEGGDVHVVLDGNCEYIEGTGYSRCQSGNNDTCLAATGAGNEIHFPECENQPGSDRPNHVEFSFTCPA